MNRYELATNLVNLDDPELLHEINFYPIPTIDLTVEVSTHGSTGVVSVSYVPDAHFCWSTSYSHLVPDDDQMSYLHAVGFCIDQVTVRVKQLQIYEKRFGKQVQAFAAGDQTDLAAIVAKLDQRVELLERANTMR